MTESGRPLKRFFHWQNLERLRMSLVTLQHFKEITCDSLKEVRKIVLKLLRTKLSPVVTWKFNNLAKSYSKWTKLT